MIQADVDDKDGLMMSLYYSSWMIIVATEPNIHYCCDVKVLDIWYNIYIIYIYVLFDEVK